MLQNTILHLHAITAVIIISLFVLRFIGQQINAPFMAYKWLRILPRINDTCLLIFGITLIFLTKQYPNLSSHLWLTEKLCFLVGFIVFGVFALKAKTANIRYLTFTLALACFACIVYLVKLKIPF